MATTLNVYANSTSTEQNIPTMGIGNDLWIDVDFSNDYLIWSEGGTGVADDDDEPTDSELNSAALLIDVGAKEFSYLFLYDDSQSKIKLIDNAGSQNKQYVIGCKFVGATASEPTLEAWDTNAHSTTNLHVLGNGTPANSMIMAKLTTGGLPGAAWNDGQVLAGLTQRLQLNGGGGAYGAGTNYAYFNIKVTVPGGYGTGEASTPVLTVRYTWN